MNFFGVELKGVHGVFKERTFYKPKASAKERTFVCEGGPGCNLVPNTSLKITGHWLSDKARDTVSSYDFEYVLVDGKKVKPLDMGGDVAEIAHVVKQGD